MPGFERPQGRADAEQLPEEILQLRRELDQQRGLVLRGESCRIGTCGGEPRREGGIGVGEVGDEQRVDSCSAFRRVEIGKVQSVGEVRHGGG